MSIVCAISGEIPDVPTVSHVSGHVFEKRLLEKWIEDKGTDPVNNEPLDMEQTTDIKNADTIVRPRAPAWTSVPGILKALQDEWDALMLHQFGLRDQLQSSRQELSHTLYQHDASCRVIARLQRETAESKEALAELRPLQAQLMANGGMEMDGEVPSSGPQRLLTEEEKQALRAEHKLSTAQQKAPDMEVIDGAGDDANADPTNRPLSINVVEEIQKHNEELTRARKRRHKAKDSFPELAKTEELMNFAPVGEGFSGFHSTSHKGILDFNMNDELLPGFVLTAGVDKTAILFDMEHEAVAATLKGHSKKVMKSLIHPSERMAITASVDQTVKLWALQTDTENPGVCLETFRIHKGTVAGVSLHPIPNYLLTAGYDGTWNFVDLPTSSVMTCVKSDFEFSACQVHPDGRIFATGTQGSKNGVCVWDISERQQVHMFEGHTDGVTSISFSDNGYYMASGSKDGTARIWDLRKLKCKEELRLVEDAPVNAVQFDDSGSYLACSAGEKIIVHTAGKQFNNLVELEGHDSAVTCLRWGKDAHTLYSSGMDGRLMQFKMGDLEDQAEEQEE
jgi:pre-mRNA-processing factor 19